MQKRTYDFYLRFAVIERRVAIVGTSWKLVVLIYPQIDLQRVSGLQIKVLKKDVGVLAFFYFYFNF